MTFIKWFWKKTSIILKIYLSVYLLLVQIATTSPQIHQFLHTASFESFYNHTTNHQNILNVQHNAYQDNDDQCAVTLLALGITPTPTFDYDFTSQEISTHLFLEHKLYISFQSNKNFNPRAPPQNLFT